MKEIKQIVGHYVIVETIQEDTEIGEFVVSDYLNDSRYIKGKILSAHTDLLVKDGEIIKYDKRAADSILIEDNTYHVIQQQDIIYIYN